jgi:type 1 glutamine amidotransferase
MQIVVMMAAAAILPGIARGGESPAKTKTLVVWGGHGFEHDPFMSLFKDNPGLAVTEAQHAGTATGYGRDDLAGYDVVVLYDFWQKITDDEKKKFLSIFEKGTGLVVLHHALADFQDWPEFEKAVGGKFFLRPETRDGKEIPKSGTGGGELTLHVEAGDHPVTKGLEDFKLQDEFYNACRVGEDVKVLLTTDNPKNQRQIAWCREHGKSRVVYIMSGHDKKVYDHPSYRKLLANAIQWAARK